MTGEQFQENPTVNHEKAFSGLRAKAGQVLTVLIDPLWAAPSRYAIARNEPKKMIAIGRTLALSSASTNMELRRIACP
jgi:hypothetical protein